MPYENWAHQKQHLSNGTFFFIIITLNVGNLEPTKPSIYAIATVIAKIWFVHTIFNDQFSRPLPFIITQNNAIALHKNRAFMSSPRSSFQINVQICAFSRTSMSSVTVSTTTFVRPLSLSSLRSAFLFPQLAQRLQYQDTHIRK